MPRTELQTLIRGLRRTVRPEGREELTDTQLLQRWVAHRDEAALEVLLWRHGPMVLGVCRRVLRHEQDAEDAFQATFLTLVDRAETLRVGRALSSWLYKVAYRAALLARAESQRRSVLQARAAEQTVQREQDNAWAELSPVLDEELTRLPEKYRRPFILCFLEGKTNAEAARQLCCPEGTIATRLAWARRRLRVRLARRGLVLTAAALAATLPQAVEAGTPGRLVHATVQEALSFIAGDAVTSSAAHLARGVIKTMFVDRLKTAAAVLLALGLIVAGVGLSARSGQTPAEPIVSSPLPARQDVPVKPDPKPSRVEVVKSALLRLGGGTPESEAAVAAGLDWLARHQAADGHWSLEGAQLKSDAAATALGVLPFLGAGITHQSAGPHKAHAKTVELALQWLVRNQTEAGGFEPQMYAHALATMALANAYGLTGDANLKEPAQKAVDYIVKGQTKAGGWSYTPNVERGDTSITGWQVQALKIGELAGLTVPEATFQGASKFLDGTQARDGGYGYIQPNPTTPTMTASGLLSRQLMGVDANDNLLRSGIGLLNRAQPVPNNLYHDYYGTQVMFLSGGQTWQDWNDRMRNRLIALQDNAGKADDRGSWAAANDKHVVGRVYTTSLALMTLEVYYRLDLLLEARARHEAGGKKGEILWEDVINPEFKGRTIIWSLVRDPRPTLAMIREKVKPVAAADPEESRRIEQLVRDLDSDTFAVRDKATEELEKLGVKAEPALRKALDNQPAVEVKRRAQRLLDKVASLTTAARTRDERAVAVLELIDSPESREVLQAFANGAEDAWLTRQAKAALKRLSK